MDVAEIGCDEFPRYVITSKCKFWNGVKWVWDPLAALIYADKLSAIEDSFHLAEPEGTAYLED